uniref:Uncharacterized protein n=1 Tax=Magallana gigas TaxID=29159 RepID=K1P8L7_MAGGI
MNLNPLDYPVDAPEPETKTDFRKRLFCNTGGCFGRRKRSTSQTLERRLNNRGSKDSDEFVFLLKHANKQKGGEGAYVWIFYVIKRKKIEETEVPFFVATCHEMTNSRKDVTTKFNGKSIDA